MMTPKKLHDWYLEATKELNPKSFNPNAQKEYSELTEDQKFIDKYIAEKVDQFYQDKFEQQKADLIEKIEKMKPTLEELGEKGSYNCGYDDGLDDIIKIIKEA